MKLSPVLLGAFTLLCTAMTVPAIAGDDTDDPPRIRSVTPFSLKKASGSGCPDAGGGCVITIFEDGTVTATNVD